jgi:HAD superfamily hydrolase (TIGR01490 family)
MPRAGAFFDLDRTLLRRSSALALARPVHERGLIGRGQLVKAAVWQLVFAARGASAQTVGRAAEDGLMILHDLRPEELRDLVAEALDPVLKPLVYREPLELARRHRERGEPTYIVSAALQEIVDALADELGFAGAVGTVCEVEDGAYTGRPVRSCHGPAKADAIRELAQREAIDLAASTGYSDSHTDLPFVEAVGKPVAVNPNRGLRRVAAERRWPVLRVRELAHSAA